MTVSFLTTKRDRMGDSGTESRRPWGFYEVLSDDRSDHKVKRITVWPGKRLSLQYHRRRAEHWIVVAGRALVTVNGKELVLSPGGSIDVPIGALHRVESASDVPLVFIEVQQGEYFGEDDIVRLEDDFGRA
ncbi:MAG TPA: phosphomannose isomerase type II C-terminal cupin domain [Deltaproteobacteria bacterium]|nr:phosphomannose isomerase type II C-terminal cupin domain [Deltaproteobacteria bacterium]HQI82712.1 phosphomannose isomerase type II C-terminal cupin domain [Deltaproteobacteria bacterium]